MIKNEYTDRINEIKAPQSAVENAVKAALEADKNRKEVIAMPKKSKIIKIVSAAAACVLVVTGVAVASNMNSTKPIVHDNSAPSQTETSVVKSFALIVNAAELTEENTVGLSELSMSGVNSMGIESMSVELVDIDDKTSKLRAVWYPTIDFPVVCRGSGIESITYKINNAVFLTNENLPLVEEKSEKSMLLSEYDGRELPDDTDTYSTFTVSYDEQLKADSIAYIALKPTSKLDIDENDVFTKRALDYLENIPNFDEYIDFINGEKYPELRGFIMKAEIQDVTIDITVNYTDGTTETYPISLGISGNIETGKSISISARFSADISPYERAALTGELNKNSKLTLEGMKQIIADALAQVEDESELSNYLFTVPEYIKSKIDEIQPVPNNIGHTDPTSYFYCLDADDFENCHQAIVLYGSTQATVYEEYDDDHKVINSEVLYDINPYVQKLR